MTDAERDLYIEAVNLAFEQGIWTKFVLVSDTKTGASLWRGLFESVAWAQFL